MKKRDYREVSQISELKFVWFNIWGLLKDKVLSVKPRNLEHLRKLIKGNLLYIHNTVKVQNMCKPVIKRYQKVFAMKVAT